MRTLMDDNAELKSILNLLS